MTGVKTAELAGERIKSGKFVAVHGMHKTRTHTCWVNMKSRCLNPKNKSYSRYGGRGISVCKRWMDFANFLADMGIQPENMSIDRIDVNGNYSPDNCKWSSKVDQQRNTSKNQIITAYGESKTVAEWADLTGIGRSTLSYRARKGWSGEDAISVLPTPRNRIAAKLGETVSVPTEFMERV
ncbi:hypothetical protein KLEP174_gp48 [Pseudomonas phage vB_PcuM_ KLEP17-4]|nr:hypothetical protein KLEP174_gp48 [Pseudomonas phage vB_PcuM_ KLEP17-4]